MTRDRLDETFPGDDLDRMIWSPHYLPHWSSRAESAATFEVRNGELHLTVPADQPLWCADRHAEPLRVSAIQSASWSGPVGSTIGPQPFLPGLTVREQQPAFRGYTPLYGDVEIAMRGVIGARSMVAFWLSGLDDAPGRSGEICVAEIFGDAIRDGIAQIGMGIKAFRDPFLREAFATEPVALDVAAFHTYGVSWRRGSVAFTVDDREVRRLDQAPDYPLQLEIGVFDFPDRPARPGDPAVPELVIAHVRGRPARGVARSGEAAHDGSGSPGSGPVATGSPERDQSLYEPT
jgi:hypothetical protein